MSVAHFILVRPVRRLILVAHLALIAVGVFSGYASLSPDALRGTNPDQYFAIASFVTAVIFPLLAVPIYGGRHTTFRAASWSRLSFNWWRDPLQCLFVSTYSAGAMALGAGLHLRGTSSTGFWMFMFFVALFSGFVIGQLITYALYRTRITKV